MEINNRKQGERSLIEEARRRSSVFPPAPLSAFESPDWLISDAALGIEVSDVMPNKGENLFSGAQLSSFQANVVETARQYYFAQCQTDADVLVFFQNEWNRKRDPYAYGISLAISSGPTSPLKAVA
jgi:hypothetical protein